MLFFVILKPTLQGAHRRQLVAGSLCGAQENHGVLLLDPLVGCNKDTYGLGASQLLPKSSVDC